MSLKAFVLLDGSCSILRKCTAALMLVLSTWRGMASMSLSCCCVACISSASCMSLGAAWVYEAILPHCSLHSGCPLPDFAALDEDYHMIMCHTSHYTDRRCMPRAPATMTNKAESSPNPVHGGRVVEAPANVLKVVVVHDHAVSCVGSAAGYAFHSSTIHKRRASSEKPGLALQTHADNFPKSKVRFAIKVRIKERCIAFATLYHFVRNLCLVTIFQLFCHC